MRRPAVVGLIFPHREYRRMYIGDKSMRDGYTIPVYAPAVPWRASRYSPTVSARLDYQTNLLYVHASRAAHHKCEHTVQHIHSKDVAVSIEYPLPPRFLDFALVLKCEVLDVQNIVCCVRPHCQ